MSTDPAAARPRILYGDGGPEAPYPLTMEGTVISGFGRGSKELGIPTANLPVDGNASAAPWIADARSGVYFGWAALALPDHHPDSPLYRGAGGAKDPKRDEGDGKGAVGEQLVPEESGPATTTSRAMDVTTASTTNSTTASAQDPPLDPPAPPPSTNTATQHWHIYPMVMSIGYNPFYKNRTRSAEVHVLSDFGADFYGVPVRLLVCGFVREERDYAGLDALVADIRVDCDVARQSLARDAWTPRQGVVGGGRGSLDGSWLVR
ncbi:riboflavin kinase [Xylariomycetidae sp. FL0641]|nr:riboflavin kinase [Xylariomycetidae sp. FL0641]